MSRAIIRKKLNNSLKPFLIQSWSNFHTLTWDASSVLPIVTGEGVISAHNKYSSQAKVKWVVLCFKLKRENGVGAPTKISFCSFSRGGGAGLSGQSSLSPCYRSTRSPPDLWQVTLFALIHQLDISAFFLCLLLQKSLGCSSFPGRRILRQKQWKDWPKTNPGPGDEATKFFSAFSTELILIYQLWVLREDSIS